VKVLLALSIVCLCGQLLAVDSTPLPDTDAELNRWCPEPPAGKNAAAPFVQGFAAINVTNQDWQGTNLPWLGKAPTPPIDRPLTPSLANAIKEYLGRNENAFNDFRQAAVLKESRYPWDLTLGPNSQLKHLSGVKLASKSLALYVLDRANSGDGDKAAEGLMLQLALIESLESEPILISQEVRANCVHYLLYALTQALNRVNLPAKRVDEIEKRLGGLERMEAEGYGFKRGLVGEKVLIRDMFDMPAEKMAAWYLENTIMGITKEDRAIVTGKYARKTDDLFATETSSQVLAAWEVPYPDRFKQVADLCKTRLALAETNKYPVASVQLRWISGALEEEANALLCFRLMKTAVGLQRFSQDHDNKYPDALAQMVPIYLKSLPENPTDGQSLKYKKSNRGYLLSGTRRETKFSFAGEGELPWQITIVAAPESK
jgi:hypothetical protein